MRRKSSLLSDAALVNAVCQYRNAFLNKSALSVEAADGVEGLSPCGIEGGFDGVEGCDFPLGCCSVIVVGKAVEAAELVVVEWRVL